MSSDKGYIWFHSGSGDGQFLSADHAPSQLWSNAFHYATGVFEGIRAYTYASDSNQRVVFRLHEHIERLFASAKALGMVPPVWKGDIANVCLEVLRRNPGHTYIRPNIFRGDGLGIDPSDIPVCVSVISAAWGRYITHSLHNGGATLQMSGIRRPTTEEVPFVRSKCTPMYGVHALAKQEARRRGFSDSILLAPKGPYISEATGANICLVDADGNVVTPDESSYCLSGITLDTVRTLLKEGSSRSLTSRSVSFQELGDAAEVFLTGTAVEVTPVTKVGETVVGVPHTELYGCPGRVTQELMQLYRQVVTGESDIGRSHGWLTPVSLG